MLLLGVVRGDFDSESAIFCTGLGLVGVDQQVGGREVVCGLNFDRISKISSDFDLKCTIGVSHVEVLVEHGDVRAHGGAGGRRDLQAPLCDCAMVGL